MKDYPQAERHYFSADEFMNAHSRCIVRQLPAAAPLRRSIAEHGCKWRVPQAIRQLAHHTIRA